ncbi:MAG: hypothetical protein AB8B50_13070, partial [Pirellulaceae bacterium]
MRWFNKESRKLRTRAQRKRYFERLEDRRLLAADLLVDIDTSDSAITPDEGVVVSDIAYFPYTDEAGTELWRSDGTTAGTFRLADISPGGNYNSSYPRGFLAFDSGFVFDADDASGSGLWYSDGTSAGTIKLADNELFLGATEKAVVGSELFFTKYDGSDGDYELWKTDGTVGGTVIVKNDLFSSPQQLTGTNTALFFTYYDFGLGNELWTSNGTSAGTFLLKDITQDNGYTTSSDPEALVAVGNKLFFTA